MKMSNEENVLKMVAIRIKELRGEKTQKEFAQMLDVSPQAVSEWENANKMPRMGIIEKLSIIYDVPKSYILGENSSSIVPKESMLKLYSNIKRLRIENSLTQEELAKRAGYTDRSMITKIEKGLVDLQQTKIEQFASIFNVSSAYLMGWEDKKGNVVEEGDFVISKGKVSEYEKLNDENKKKLDDYFRLLMMEQLNKGE